MNKTVRVVANGEAYVDELCTHLIQPSDIEPWEQDSGSLFFSGSAGSNTITNPVIPMESSGDESNCTSCLPVTVIEPPRFSFFRRPITNKIPCEEITLTQLHAILTSDHAKEATEELRTISDVDAAKDFKRKNFDFVTPAGVFSSRKADQLINPSGLIVMDIDGLPDEDAVETTFQSLLSIQILETLLLFRSPSGHGLKWIVPVVNNEGHDHGFYFKAVSNFLKTIGVFVDPSGSDICRACFVPYDPDAFINPMCM